MALSISEIVPGLPIKAEHLVQFYNLFTGVMTDQNVNLAGSKTWFNGIGCRVYNSALIELPVSGSEVALTFNSERFDNDSMHSTSSNTGQLVCRTAGLYFIFFCLEFEINGTGMRRGRIRLNGATSIAGNTGPGDGAIATMVSGGTVYQMAVNDYVEVLAMQTSGGSLDVLAIPNDSPEFGMIKVG